MLPNSPERSDLREDRQGIALRLTVTVVDHYLCTPVENAIVDIWSTDADGLYSGVLNDQFGFTDFEPIGEPINMLDNPTFLRGHQITGADGRVEFVTIFPGWYMSRLTHVHIRALIAGQDWTAFDTQLFFPDEIQRMVYRSDAYKSRGPNPIGIDRDWELRGNVAALNDLTIPLSKSSDGLAGEAILAIST